MRFASIRRLVLFRAIAVALLAWTAIDLGASQLCALDVAPPPALVGQAATGGDSMPETPAPVHVDDCFCCSHCVDVGVFQPVLLGLRFASPVLIPDPAEALGTGRRLFHPPQRS